MKKIALFILMFTGLSASAQVDTTTIWVNQTEHIYKITLSGVADLPAAKEATDFLRSYFQVFPEFRDELDMFIFRSPVLATETDFILYMMNNGYVVTAFSRTAHVEVEPSPIKQR